MILKKRLGLGEEVSPIFQSSIQWASNIHRLIARRSLSPIFIESPAPVITCLGRCP